MQEKYYIYAFCYPRGKWRREEREEETTFHLNTCQEKRKKKKKKHDVDIYPFALSSFLYLVEYITRSLSRGQAKYV